MSPYRCKVDGRGGSLATKSTSYGEKQLIPTEAADDGKARHEGLDRARNGMAGETVVPVPAGDGARGERCKRAQLEAPEVMLDIEGRGHG